MSTNWKVIGKNSGNMSQYRNVTHNKLNYENGKLNSIYDVSGIKTKGYTFDICGENIVLGVGTDKPFSRLSLGNNTGSGEFKPTEPGQLAAIALDESGNGHGFTGIVLNSDILNQTGTKTKGIQIMSLTKDFSMNDISGGRIILSNDNVTTIGGEARESNEGTEYKGSKSGVGINYNRKVVLDVRGSIRTDGYINFYNKPTDDTYEPAGSDWNTHKDVPIGSLFLTRGGSYGPEGLYYKKTTSELHRLHTTETDSTDISAAFDISDAYIVAKGKTANGSKGGIPVTFSGNSWDLDETALPKGFNNAVTIRDGNLAVTTPSGDEFKVRSKIFTDMSGGIILAERQLLIGDLSNNSNHERYGYGLLDVQAKNKVPTLLGYSGLPTYPLDPSSATNSIILLTVPSDEANSLGENIGKTYDCSNTIIIGNTTFENISVPNSIISVNKLGTTNGSKIQDISGGVMVFGGNNDLSGSPFSIIFGTGNTINNTYNHDGIQNFVFGKNNKLYHSKNSFVQGENNKNFGEFNLIFGKNNKAGADGDKDNYNYRAKGCFIQGTNNIILAPSGNEVAHSFIAGLSNTLDLSYSNFISNNNHSYTLLGTSARINEDLSHVRFAFGTKAMDGNVFTIDLSGNVEISGNLLVKGEKTEFRTEYFDVSDNNLSLNYGNSSSPNGGGITLIDNYSGGNKGLIWNKNGPYDSLDCWDTSGSDISTNHIFANNIISNDISANDISCVDISAVNFFGTLVGDHTITIATQPNITSVGALTSLVVSGDLSGNDASFNDISAVNFFGTLVGDHTITTATQPNITSVGALTSLVVSGDLSGNDASFNDISAVNFFSVGSSFFGDVHATKASSFNDISANDISCVDISASTLTLIGNKLYANNVEFTFPTTGGELGAQGQGAGAFPGIGTTANKCYDGGLGNDISNNVASNTGNITSNTGNISTNSSDIGTNTASISSNASDIGTNTTNISGKQPLITASTDLSVNDISCVDISATNFFSVGSSFFGDVHVTGASSFNDISANNIFLQGDISANDASFNDLSLNYLYVHNDISANNIFLQGDISANDASFNDLSLNYLYVHNDISANNIFLQGDISCVDISCVDIKCVDISASHFYNVGTLSQAFPSPANLSDISSNLNNLIIYLTNLGIIK